MNKFYKLLPLSVLAVVSSCAKTFYIQPTNDSVATVSFSNLSDELADIYIITNEKSYPIKDDLIERKKTTR